MRHIGEIIGRKDKHVVYCSFILADHIFMTSVITHYFLHGVSDYRSTTKITNISNHPDLRLSLCRPPCTVLGSRLVASMILQRLGESGITSDDLLQHAK